VDSRRNTKLPEVEPIDFPFNATSWPSRPAPSTKLGQLSVRLESKHGCAVSKLPKVVTSDEVKRLADLKAKLPTQELAWRERIARLDLSEFSGFSARQLLGEDALLDAAQTVEGED
jgi:hypothetical protein